MKVYLFHPDTGMYLGEDFADEIVIGKGGGQLPPDATAIAPPEAGQGLIPVFHALEGRWVVKSVSEFRTFLEGRVTKKR